MTDAERKRYKGIRKRPDTPFLQMYVTINGQLHRESTGTSDWREAKKIRDAWLVKVRAQAAKLIEADPERSLERQTMKALFDAEESRWERDGLRSTKSNTAHLKQLRKVFDDVLVWRPKGTLTWGELGRRYQDKRLAAGAKPATINRETFILVHAMKPFLEEQHRKPLPVIKRLPEENTREGFFEEYQVVKLVAAFRDLGYPHLADVTMFGWWCGWRKAEILGLRWPEILGLAGSTAHERASRLAGDAEGDPISIQLGPKRSKNRRARTLVLTGPMLELIQQRYAQADGEFVFHDGYGHRIGQDFRKPWNRACAEIGLTGRLFHDLRRSAVRQMNNAGVPQQVAMSITGHRSPAVYNRYGIVAPAEQIAAAARAWRSLEAPAIDTTLSTEPSEQA